MKILKNNTPLEILINDVGLSVAASGALLINPSDYDKFAQSIDTSNLIVSGFVTVNTGYRDLTSYLGLAHIKEGLPEVLTFDNSINDFISTQVQAAVEESSDSFGWYIIKETKNLLIKTNRQMVVGSELQLEGSIDLEGRLAVL